MNKSIEMAHIQEEAHKNAGKELPPLDNEHIAISNEKRKSIDQPPLRHKIDPLR